MIMKITKRLWQTSPLFLSLIGGILMGLTPSPVEAWPLAWIGLVPLWFLIVSNPLKNGESTPGKLGNTSQVSSNLPQISPTPHSPLPTPQKTARNQSLQQSALYGLIWGIGYHGLALFWITGIHPMDWMGVPWLASMAIALFCWIFITLWGAIFVAIWSAVITVLNNSKFKLPYGNAKGVQNSKFKTLTRVLMGTALWCGLETLWSVSPLWWSSLSYTQSPHNLVILHLGQLSGPLAVTAAIVAVNGLIAEALVRYLHNQNSSFTIPKTPHPTPNHYTGISTYLSLALGLFITLHLMGFALYSRPLIQLTEAAINVGIIQGNIPNRIKLYPEGWRRAIEGYTRGYQTLADQGVEAVLTPETALPFLWDEQVRLQSSFYAAILNKGILAWVGAFGEEEQAFTNSLFTITGEGKTFSRYDKVKLVPLGEYIPFKNVVGGLVNRLSPLDIDLQPGKNNQIFETPFGKAIVGICYESAFPNHFRRQAKAGGQFILTASNNAHYSETMPAQHHAQDVMRAIESDRWAVRATNTGYSGIVDPHGKTRWLSGINTYEIHKDIIYRRQTQTLYVRWGDWLTPLLLVVGCLLLVVC